MNTRPESPEANVTIDLLVRESYGRLLAYLMVRWQDITAAEDALSVALLSALETWPQNGIPDKPESWLLKVAHHHLIDVARRDKRLEPLPEQVENSGEGSSDLEAWHLPDERLRMMLTCAHPAIDASVRPALILQTVLGLDALSLAPAFLLSPEAMGKRLVRAKKKIRETGVSFETPDANDLPERLHDLLEAIYAAYCLGQEGTLIEGDFRSELKNEALQLARILATLLPEEAEALGFSALLLFCESRRAAQLDSRGNFVPLLEQETTRWNFAMIREGSELLARSAQLQALGPFQIEAAIHAAHCYRARTGVIPWAEIAALYDTLILYYPTVGAEVSRAVAYAYASGNPEVGLELLVVLNAEHTTNYQPWWLAYGHLLRQQGENAKALQAFERSLGLTAQPHVRSYLMEQIRSLKGILETSTLKL